MDITYIQSIFGTILIVYLVSSPRKPNRRIINHMLPCRAIRGNMAKWSWSQIWTWCMIIVRIHTHSEPNSLFVYWSLPTRVQTYACMYVYIELQLSWEGERYIRLKYFQTYVPPSWSSMHWLTNSSVCMTELFCGLIIDNECSQSLHLYTLTPEQAGCVSMPFSNRPTGVDPCLPCTSNPL